MSNLSVLLRCGKGHPFYPKMEKSVIAQWRIQDFPNGGGAVLSQMGGRTSCFQVKSA